MSIYDDFMNVNQKRLEIYKKKLNNLCAQKKIFQEVLKKISSSKKWSEEGKQLHNERAKKPAVG